MNQSNKYIHRWVILSQNAPGKGQIPRALSLSLFQLPLEILEAAGTAALCKPWILPSHWHPGAFCSLIYREESLFLSQREETDGVGSAMMTSSSTGHPRALLFFKLFLTYCTFSKKSLLLRIAECVRRKCWHKQWETSELGVGVRRALNGAQHL